jgi:hypothetical protein
MDFKGFCGVGLWLPSIKLERKFAFSLGLLLDYFNYLLLRSRNERKIIYL